MTAQTQEEILAAHLEEQKINVISLSVSCLLFAWTERFVRRISVWNWFFYSSSVGSDL